MKYEDHNVKVVFATEDLKKLKAGDRLLLVRVVNRDTGEAVVNPYTFQEWKEEQEMEMIRRSMN